MEPTLVSDLTKDEVLRKIGRNVLLFSKLECLIKDLLAKATVEGPPQMLTSIRQEKADKRQKQTLGTILPMVSKDLFSPPPSTLGDPPPETEQETWVSFSFRINLKEPYLTEWKQRLENLRQERNALVHGISEKWEPASQKKMETLSKSLDEQETRVQHELDFLLGRVANQRKLGQLLAEFLALPIGEALWGGNELFQKTAFTELIGFLWNRRLEWTHFTEAVNHCRRVSSGDYADLKKYCGKQSLKRMLAATGWFDFREETTPRGGSWVLVRLKPPSAAGGNPNSLQNDQSGQE